MTGWPAGARNDGTDAHPHHGDSGGAGATAVAEASAKDAAVPGGYSPVTRSPSPSSSA